MITERETRKHLFHTLGWLLDPFFSFILSLYSDMCLHCNFYIDCIDRVSKAVFIPFIPHYLYN